MQHTVCCTSYASLSHPIFYDPRLWRRINFENTCVKPLRSDEETETFSSTLSELLPRTIRFESLIIQFGSLRVENWILYLYQIINNFIVWIWLIQANQIQHTLSVLIHSVHPEVLSDTLKNIHFPQKYPLLKRKF